MFTRPGDAIKIQEAIGEALKSDNCTCFIDAFACVGGDTLAAMNQFTGAEIFSVQVNTGTGRVERLRHNVNMLQDIIPRTGTVQVEAMDIETFILGLAPRSDVSVLYLDPPWAMGPDPVTYSNPVVINHHFERKVWTPLRRKAITPLLIVLKLPGNPTLPTIEAWPTLLGVQYRRIECLGFRNYAVHILRLV